MHLPVEETEQISHSSDITMLQMLGHWRIAAPCRGRLSLDTGLVRIHLCLSIAISSHELRWEISAFVNSRAETGHQ